MTAITKILVPVDYSSASVEALEYAVYLGDKTGAEVVVLHAWELPPHTGPEVMVNTTGGAESLTDYVRGRAGSTLQEFLEPYRTGRDVAIQGHLVHGSPYQAIIDTAAEVSADMIVMGTHGRTGLSRMFLGSVADQVIRHAPCPVVTIRAREPDEKSAATPTPEPPHPPGEKPPNYVKPHVYGYSDDVTGGLVENDKNKGSMW